jgi:uncharacterized membrane protein
MSRLRTLAGPFFIVAGALHFIRPRLYRAMMPPWVPAPDAMVVASGAAEIAGGAGLMLSRTRRPAGWWLVATLIGVFPANLHMALHPEQYSKIPGGSRALWARLPVQGVFIAWVLASGRRRVGEAG